MSDTTRKRILIRVESIMKDLGFFNHTEINRMTVIDIDEVALPSAFVYSGPEARLRSEYTPGVFYQQAAVIGQETFEWKVFIEVWGENLDLEELLGRIHKAMYEDYTIGGEAAESCRTGVEMWVIDPERVITAMLIEYTVLYRHELGIM